MAKRGVLYLTWGNDSKTTAALHRSVAALRRWHPELGVEVARGEDRGPFEGLLQKAAMLERSPFEETLFLDADTVVMGRLDFGFEKARQFGLACCICECPWARRYRRSIAGDTVEYNTGVLFWTKRAKPVFDAWREQAATLDSSIDLVRPDGKPGVMPYNDQASFAAALELTSVNPCALPLNWNFRPMWHKTFFGPIKIWHDYSEPPAALLELNQIYEHGAVISFHKMA